MCGGVPAAGAWRFTIRWRKALDVEAPIEERTPGELGTHLVLKTVEIVTYEHKDGKNQSSNM